MFKQTIYALNRAFFTEKRNMCGIFGFIMKNPFSKAEVFGVLEKLEVHQYPQEPTPIGGYGAGIAILDSKRQLTMEKIGKADSVSPARKLAEMTNFAEASVVVSHLRMPSPEFMHTAMFKEATQPYVAKRDNVTIVSVHNGKVTNYRELGAELDKAHVFESEKIELIDSEVIPHIYAESLSTQRDSDAALYELFCKLQGSSAIAMLQIEPDKAFMHFVHKGKTRGLTIWIKEHGELIFCSRKEPLIAEFENVLKRGNFAERISIAYHEDTGLKLSFPINFR
jgi:glucosamine 6-phosphate synthetase-like amidotransferase/phosphosugar isomerase protein